MNTLNKALVSDMASALWDGGWKPWDRDEMKIEYNLEDDEANAIVRQLAVYTPDNDKRIRDAIAPYMRDDIREDLHEDLAPCGFSDFSRAYIDADPEFYELLKTEFSWLYDYWL